MVSGVGLCDDFLKGHGTVGLKVVSVLLEHFKLHNFGSIISEDIVVTHEIRLVAFGLNVGL